MKNLLPIFVFLVFSQHAWAMNKSELTETLANDAGVSSAPQKTPKSSKKKPKEIVVVGSKSKKSQKTRDTQHKR